MITIQNVHKHYGDVQALNGINLTIPDGEMFGLVGADGAAKSSLLRMLCGLIAPSEGTIDINGASPLNIKHTIGYVSQLFALYPNLSVYENLELYGRLYDLTKDELHNKCNALAEYVGLGNFKDRMSNDLSGGMKQKLALAVALLNTPRLLILDEPSTGVDPLSRRELWTLIKKINQEGTTVVVATPFMDEADYCSQIAFFEAGQILALGTPQDLRTQTKVASNQTLDEVYIRLVNKNNELTADYTVQHDFERLADKPVVIQTEDLVRRFGDFTSVNKLNITIKEGEIFGLLGSNGCGKSTTIRMLCGTLTPTTGQIEVLNTDVTKHVSLIKSQLGYMSQKFSLYADLTVMENLTFYGRIYGLKPAELTERINIVIDELELHEIKNRLVRELPTGWRQRASLGAAILHKPAILYLDEPTSGVDPLTRRQFWTVINKLSDRGTTILVTTHFMDEAEQCDRILFMDKGQKIIEGRPKVLKETTPGAHNLEDAFIYYMKQARSQ